MSLDCIPIHAINGSIILKIVSDLDSGYISIFTVLGVSNNNCPVMNAVKHGSRGGRKKHPTKIESWHANFEFRLDILYAPWLLKTVFLYLGETYLIFTHASIQ